jgi:hypothetical protein
VPSADVLTVTDHDLPPVPGRDHGIRHRIGCVRTLHGRLLLLGWGSHAMCCWYLLSFRSFFLHRL